MQDQPTPESPVIGNGIDSQRRRRLDAATSAMILSGFAAFFGLAGSLFYTSLEDTAEENIHVWYVALWCVLSGFAVLSIAISFLRRCLLPAQLRNGDTAPLGLSRKKVVIGGLVAAEVAAIIGLITALTYFAWLDIEDPDASFFWTAGFWCTTAGMSAAAAAAALACIRLGLFLTLAWIVAGCAFALVIAAGLIIQIIETNGRSYTFSPEAFALGLLALASLGWCLVMARRMSMQKRPVAWTATTLGSFAIVVFGMSLWVVGLGNSTAERPLPQATPHPVTWEAVRTIIAQQLHVPEERVTPNSRLREDLNAKTDDIERILDAFDTEFGTESEPPDDEMILTAQDALDYAQSPDTFREQASDKR